MKLNKRATLSAAAVLSLGAIVAILGTTAYFKDTESKTNVFTVGNVTLNVTEKQRSADGDYSTTCDINSLPEFNQEKVITPIIGSETSGHYDACHMPDIEYTKNYGDKIVTIKNTGNSDAYVRAYVAVPETLDNAQNASDNLLHFNFGRNDNDQKTDDTSYDTNKQLTSSGDWLWASSVDLSGDKAVVSWKSYNDNAFTIKSLDGSATTTTRYTIYYADYNGDSNNDGKLGAGNTAPRFLNGAYLDANITDITRTVADTPAGGTTTITKTTQQGDSTYTLDFNVDKYGLQMPVYVVAVQADGFDSADAAFTAALGANWRPTFALYTPDSQQQP